MDDIARVLLQRDGGRVEGQRLVPEDIGEPESYRVAPQVGLDDGANGLVVRPAGVRVGKGEREVRLDVGGSEPRRRGRQRLVRRHWGDVHEICCWRRGPAGHPVLGVSTLIIIPVGEGRRGDAETEQGKQCRSGRLEEMSTRASREREANWTGIHDALLSRMAISKSYG